MEKGLKCIKHTLFIINLMFAILGLTIVGLGVMGLYQFGSLSWFIIVFGKVVFFISFFGCCGAIQEVPCMIITYQVFIVLLISGGILVVVPLFMYSATIKDVIVDNVHEQFNTQSSEISAFLEQNLGCCGFNGVSDYRSLQIPLWCCRKVNTTCTIDKANKVGCQRKTAEFLDILFYITSGIFAGYFVILITAFIFALFLNKAIFKDSHQTQYVQVHRHDY